MSLFTAKAIAVFCGVIGGLPLLLYPAVLMANMMSLAAPRSGNEPILLQLVAYGFLFGSLAYPLVYGVCLVLLVPSWIVGNLWGIVVLSLVPIGYLLLVAALYGLSGALERWRKR